MEGIEVKRYPLAPLAEAMHLTPYQACERLGATGRVGKAYRDRGVSEVVADRLATKAGLSAYEVWPELRDDVIASVVCAAEGCDETFDPTNPRRIYCSNLCRDRRHKARWARERYRTDPEYRAAQIERTARYHREVTVPARERRRSRAA